MLKSKAVIDKDYYYWYVKDCPGFIVLGRGLLTCDIIFKEGVVKFVTWV